jgi:hypothetical protein
MGNRDNREHEGSEETKKRNCRSWSLDKFLRFVKL